MPSLERYAVYCGLLAPVVSLGSTGLSTALAPASEFTWQAYALSDLGRRGARTFLLFNGGLILGGLLGAAFAWPLWRHSRNLLERVGTVVFVPTVVGLGLVGVFHLPHELHTPVALLFFIGGPVTQWLYGAGQMLADDAWFGVVSVSLGVGHVVGWVGWQLAVADSEAWFAVPEMIASLAFGLWTLALARSLLENSRRGVAAS
jgi:hypothetical membrane protein